MNKGIELKDTFSAYALNELVTKLHELDPDDYDNHGEGLNIVDLLELLLEDEQVSGCYYTYTANSEKVFATYFSDILYIYNRFGYNDDNPIGLLNSSTLLLVAMEHAFDSLLQYLKHVVGISSLKFNRVGLDAIATTLSYTDPDTIEDLIL